MTIDPNDPAIMAARERGRARGLELSREINAALERMRTTMEQNNQPPAPGSQSGGSTLRTPPAGSSNTPETDEAIQDIEEPFSQLSADDIVEAVEQDGKTVIHKVMDGERVLFATVSRPLADAFVIGWNAKVIKDAKARRSEESDRSGEADDDATSRDNSAGTSQDRTGRARRGAAEVDPRSSPGPKAQTANGGNKPKPSPRSQSLDNSQRAGEADAPPRKRGVL